MSDGPFRVGAGRTPKSVQAIVITFLVVAVLSILSSQFLGRYPPQRLLPLSLWGIESLFLWQFVTYNFVVAGPITFFFAIQLLFLAYLLWIVGTAIVEKASGAAFLRLFFLSSTIGALSAAGIMAATDSGAVLMGPTCVLYALLTAWVMFYPEQQVTLLLAIPVKLKWLIVIFLGLNFITDLGQGDYPLVVAYLASLATGYLYALLAWNLRGPFAFSQRFDDFVSNIGVRYRSSRHAKEQSKVYDFRTGKAVLDDAHFMDYALDKLTKYGKKSLTFRERWRLRRLSKRKRGP
jgi:Rhomboid family